MMVKMTYTGPGTKPPDIEVTEQEAADLEKGGLWERTKSKKNVDVKKEEDNG